ncbi:hypothetical protein LO772_14560 [Yinghuangia sp. ASG 101]|uniref:hypothetical protein n=1 Tax=Yinghuangia sp. ASG 101 TaxID=2896848 RepID=UPI001E38C2C5|nr:hypothetical protein [Yinghuangia sp. ASG 101]UGQ14691.1 hypothetical protein LO772_14560 [Yinghuangia sp. ASG 101]
MTDEQKDFPERARATALPQRPVWVPNRGDLAHDTATGRIGVVVATPEDAGGDIHHLRPEGGGTDWTARAADLTAAHERKSSVEPEPPAVGTFLEGRRHADMPTVHDIPVGSLVTADPQMSRVLVFRPGDASSDGPLRLTPEDAAALANEAQVYAAELIRLESELRTGCRRLGTPAAVKNKGVR